MLIIIPRKGEPLDRMLKRYKQKVDKVKLVKRIRERVFYKKPSVIRRDAITKAIHREEYKARHKE